MTTTIHIPKIKNYDEPSVQNNTENDVILNNGFFPNISLIAVRNAMRIDGTVTNERLKVAIIEAIATVNNELKSYQVRLKNSDIFTLEELEHEQINGESVVIQRYKRAVYCLTAANINERYRSYDTTAKGAEKSEDFDESVNDLMRDARFAIRDILGKNRTNVELI